MSEPVCRHFNICGATLTFKKSPCQVCAGLDCDRCDTCCDAVAKATTVLVTAGVPNAERLIGTLIAQLASLPPSVVSAIALQDHLQPLAEPHLKAAHSRQYSAIQHRRDDVPLTARNERRLRKKLARKGARA
jgi:hypothetical protein